MSRDRLAATLRAAAAEGLLPPDAALPPQDHRPWPVVLMMGLGAWISALPLIAAVGVLLGRVLLQGPAPYVVGLLLLAASLVVLRARAVPLFVEQFALPFLAVGLGLVGIGLFDDLPGATAAVAMAIVVLATGLAVSHAWLRALAGAGAAVLVMAAWQPQLWWGSSHLRDGLWTAWHGDLLLWLAACGVQARLRDGRSARRASALESLGSGWLLATLAGLAWWSGQTFLGIGGGVLLGDAQMPAARDPVLPAVSLALGVAAAAWAALRWPALRRPTQLAMLLVPAALCAFMPALGGVLLALAVCVVATRWKLAGAAALAAAWIVGAFYYQLGWPLAQKALVLAAAGALLGGLAWLALRAPQPPSGTPAAASAAPLAARGLIALGALAVLAVANLGIREKEDLIAHGEPIYVALAPVDPRSLMQGDYMRLNFALPQPRDAPHEMLRADRPKVVARRDARGIASLLRVADGAPLAPGEFLIELTPRSGGWMLVSDAWFFAEGEAAHYAQARYGEFRVAAGGRALLVGLRDAQLRPL